MNMRISVCIPTYNGEEYIKEQLESILCQLDLNDEIVISDDNSIDNTISIVESFNDSRIKIIHHKKSLNKKSNFRFDLTTRNMEFAINNSSGKYIFMADQDDIWEFDRVKKLLLLLKSYTLVINDCKVIDKEGNIIHNSYFKMINSKSGFIKNIIKNSYLGCCMAYRRNCFEYIMPFPKKSIPHDIWIGIMNEIYGKVLFYDEQLVLYRRHGGNLSNSGEISENSLLFKMRYRLILLCEILRRVVKI
jgi:glycosyltransferase involved in cell wall biosynthesis